jgi:hypothetical protein
MKILYSEVYLPRVVKTLKQTYPWFASFHLQFSQINISLDHPLYLINHTEFQISKH